MDRDGVASEVLYHFSTNGEPFPFMMQVAGGLTNDQSDLELATVGYHLYNEWLADWVAVDSQRLLGLAYIPIWDIDLAVKEVEWAASRGLHGVNFPPPGRPDTVLYNHPEWDPFWAACVANNMPLNTHSSGGQPIDYSGPGGIHVQVYEGGGWLSRRAVWWLIHGQVFERYPDLKLVITEQFEGWYVPTMRELDAIYLRFGSAAPGPRLPRQPSEYFAPERVPRCELHVDVAGGRRGAQRLREQRALGARLPALRRRVPTPRRSRRRNRDAHRAAATCSRTSRRARHC